MIHKLILVVTTMAIAYSVATAKAQNAEKLNSFGEWTAMSISDPSRELCYVASEPHTLEPKDRKHGKILFFVTNIPSENTLNEPSITVGYNFKEESEVSVDVDGTVFTMFTRGDTAWVKENESIAESQLVEALKAGQRMVVTGESHRGTKVKYTFSLSGITAAIKEIDSACS